MVREQNGNTMLPFEGYEVRRKYTEAGLEYGEVWLYNNASGKFWLGGQYDSYNDALGVAMDIESQYIRGERAIFYMPAQFKLSLDDDYYPKDGGLNNRK